MLTSLRRLQNRTASFLRRLSGGAEIQTSPGIPGPAMPVPAGTGLDVFPGKEDPGDLAVTRYPPFDQGIKVLPIDTILQSQVEVVDRIFRTAGVSRQDFDRFYRTAIRNLACHVHLLPATPKTYFRGTGGLFRMSLDIALNALQSANAAVFPTGGSVERRFFIQPKWTLATFLAGLCCQNYRTVNSMAVLTRDNQQWPPLLESLHDWCREREADVYFVRWLEDNHVNGAQAAAAYSISKVVPHEVLQYLASDNNQVVQAMTAAVAGVETNMSENPIGRLVAPVITRVIEDDLKRSAINYGHLVIGAHLEVHLVDAMRQLVRGGRWIANNVASGGRLWVGGEGVFLDWSTAAGDIANLLARNSFAGVPRDPDTLADLLVSANLLQKNARGGCYWTITIPGSLEVREGMVKLREGEVIFPQGFDFEPFRNVQLILAAPQPSKSLPSNQPGEGGRQDARAQPPAAKHQPKAPDSQPTGDTEDPAGQPATPAAPTASNTPTPAVAPKSRERVEKSRRQPTLRVVAGAAEGVEKGAEPTMAPVGEGGPTLDGDVSPTAAKLLGSLKRSNAWLLNEIIQAYRSGALATKVAVLPHGLGIDHEELSSHGIPVMELLEELGLKAWLWQDKTRASRRIHAVEIEGKQRRMMILKTDIAAALGFNMATKD